MEKSLHAWRRQTTPRGEHNIFILLQSNILLKINALFCSLGQSNPHILHLDITPTPMHLTQTVWSYVHGNEIHLSVSWY